MKRLLLSLAVMFACRPHSLDRGHELPLVEPNGEVLTRNFVVMADNQIHHLFGDPYWVRTQLADRVVPVAIRPVQLDLFAPDLLRWVLSQSDAKHKPVLHLGDALDIACTGELMQFFAQMQHASAGWFLAPGNHDFYFVGNGHVTRRHWKAACERAGGRLTKNAFIQRYIDELSAQSLRPGLERPDLDKLRAQLVDDPKRTSFDSSDGLLTGLRWHIDEDLPWRSFLVQRIDLSRTQRSSGPDVIAILLDTTQYWPRPRVVPLPRNAGLAGSILEDQREAVEALIESASPGILVVLMGHHPYDSLIRRARRFIDGLVKDHHVVAYVSAHTHKGHYAVHRSKFAGEEDPSTFVELNVGSLIDWPLEYRELRLKARETPGGVFPAPAGVDEGGPTPLREVVLVSPLRRIARMWPRSQEGQQCDPTWERAPEHYVAPRGAGYAVTSLATQVRLFEALLDTFEALLTTFPSQAETKASVEIETDEQAHTAIAQARALLDRVANGQEPSDALDRVAKTLGHLDDYDAARTPRDRDRRDRYRLCQAFWASKYDRLRSRAPIVDDPFVVVPLPERAHDR